MKSKHEEHALALSVWESEGGAPDRSGQFYQYDRRFEGDGTYTIHHLFTGGDSKNRPLDNGRKLNPTNAARALRVLNTLQKAPDKTMRDYHDEIVPALSKAEVRPSMRRRGRLRRV